MATIEHYCGFLFLLCMMIGVSTASVVTETIQCPCYDANLCNPITRAEGKEVFIFCLRAQNSTWLKFDWEKVTTVAIVGFYDAELMCYAHSKGARVVSLASYPASDLLDPLKRSTWIQHQVQDAKLKFLDGLNIDTEDAIDEGSPETEALTTLARETKEAFQKEIPGSQVTFDIAWSPDDIDDRHYDSVALANVTDFLFVMAYDEQSQILDAPPCTAGANSGLEQTQSGIQKFLDLGITPDKLVLGVPWYGYKYPCLELALNNTCYIPEVPFRGVNCSDAAGTEVAYNDVLILRNSSTSSGRIWDNATSSPYFNFADNDQPYQVWYDDVESLGLKYQYAVDINLRGVGMWTANYLDYSDTPAGKKQQHEMWGALPQYH